MVEAALRAKWPELEINTQTIRTSGDETKKTTESPTIAPGAAGRKGLFTAEIERALIAGIIDVAVHSAKDLPSALDSHTRIGAVLPRAATEDVLLSLNECSLETLPHGGTVATGSVRRQHQLRWKRSDLQVVDLRGNVPTRVRKLIDEKWDGIVLARAGLERLGIGPNGSSFQFQTDRLFMTVLSPDVFLPAGGQGVIALQIRSNDPAALELVEPINDGPARVCLRAEREFLRLLEADCDQPVGVSAIVDGTSMKVRAQIFTPGSTSPRAGQIEGREEDAEQLAAELLDHINGH
jgi:hydroxymethylbilane synthase